MKPEEPSALRMALVTGEESLDARVRKMRELRGTLFFKEGREAALAFLEGTGGKPRKGHCNADDSEEGGGECGREIASAVISPRLPIGRVPISLPP